VHTKYAEPVTVSPSNPYSAVPTGACLVCGDPISYQIRGRPRLYCERVRCRRRGARRRALAVAWEEGRASTEAGPSSGEARPSGPTYDDGVLVGQELGRSEATALVRLLVDKGAAFIATRSGQDFLALDKALIVARRWVEARQDAADQEPRSSSSSAVHKDQKTD
jgi:hypothetical protein